MKQLVQRNVNQGSGLEKDLNESIREKIRKEIEELSTEPIPLSRCNKAFYGKSRPRKLAYILNNIYSTDMDKLKKKWQEETAFLKQLVWLVD